MGTTTTGFPLTLSVDVNPPTPRKYETARPSTSSGRPGFRWVKAGVAVTGQRNPPVGSAGPQRVGFVNLAEPQVFACWAPWQLLVGR
jgi:hypothetical protein